MDDPAAPQPKKRGQPILLAVILLAMVGAMLAWSALSYCIVEGTPIDTPRGPVLVESLSPGDEVWTRDMASGQRQLGRVVATHPARSRSSLELRLDDGSILRVTAAHPIATPEGWREAGRLRAGDRVEGRDGPRRISAVQEGESFVRVFDLEVEPNPNFYAAGVLVHNKSSVRLSNERNAATSLKTIATAEADYRTNDRDWNHHQDYWVGDVAGLYRILVEKQPIRLIEESVALADAAPLQAPAGKVSFAPLPPWQAKAGYRCRAIPLDEQGKPIAEDLDGDGQKFESAKRFGFCAYPEHYGKGGIYTFIVSEQNMILRKDTHGTPVDRWPGPWEGWEKLD